MRRRFLDLSHPIVSGMTTYPGLPGPEVETYMGRQESRARLAPGVSFHIGRLTMVANTGTYLDAPFHFHESRADMANLPLERLVEVPITVVDARGSDAVTAATFAQTGPITARAVLVLTGWSSRWGNRGVLPRKPAPCP